MDERVVVYAPQPTLSMPAAPHGMLVDGGELYVDEWSPFSSQEVLSKKYVGICPVPFGAGCLPSVPKNFLSGPAQLVSRMVSACTELQPSTSRSKDSRRAGSRRAGMITSRSYDAAFCGTMVAPPYSSSNVS